MKILAIIVSVVSFVLAALYLTGHGPFAAPHKVHVSHGILFTVIGVLSLVWFRFQSANAVETS